MYYFLIIINLREKMTIGNIGNIKDANILLLQGPIGPFFKKLDYQLRKGGAKTYRIGLNMGDALFSYRDNYIGYHGSQDEWGEYIEHYLVENNISRMFIFGDCRYYQSVARQMATRLNIGVFVFEEGYVRPHYITLEKHGVNDYSRIPRERAFYDEITLAEIPEPDDTTPNPIYNWGIVIFYYFIAKVFHFYYKNYVHHREYSAMKELFWGLRSLARKPFYVQRDKRYIPLISGAWSKQYFFVPLQTHNDFQILQHSNYGSLEKFLIQVLESFAQHAAKEDKLIFKHHPLDRGRKDYTSFIEEQALELSIKNRILIVHDLHLPTCLQNAKGTVTINSTVGLSSLYHGTATKCLGNAIYDIDGLTCKHISLDEFWMNFKTPDRVLYQKFRQYIIQETQLNGNFYGLYPHKLKFT